MLRHKAIRLIVLAQIVTVATTGLQPTVAQGASAAGTGASVQTGFPCGYTTTNGLTQWTASAWTCGGDLVGSMSVPGNGGSAADSSSNPRHPSSHVAIPEECNDLYGTTCGRGEFGYSGGELPNGAVLLNNLDPSSGEPFACPSAIVAVGPDAAAPSTVTGGPGSNRPPALVLYPGGSPGGPPATISTTADTQCYNPYEQCSAPGPPYPLPTPAGLSCSEPNGSDSVPGKAYEAQPMNVARAFEATFLVPNSSSAGAACTGKVVAAGGYSNGGDLTTAEVYDPNPTSPTFNTWKTLSSSLTIGRDSADVVQLSSTRWMLIGGEVGGGLGSTSSYEIFDSTSCSFLPIPSTSHMSKARYDFGAAKFGAGGDVLACGGTSDFVNFTGDGTCDAFVPNPSDTISGGTWSAPTGATLSGTAADRNGLFGQYMPSTGRILIAGEKLDDDGGRGADRRMLARSLAAEHDQLRCGRVELPLGPGRPRLPAPGEHGGHLGLVASRDRVQLGGEQDPGRRDEQRAR